MKPSRLLLMAAATGRRSTWKQPFERAGRVLTWEQALDVFRDQTGRPGPSTWAVGTFPEQQGKYPVSGVSWHEAAAYCESVGKSLPTIYHWGQAASVNWSQFIGPHSNFSNAGPVEVGTTRGLSRSGALDMAGNVKEWAWNASGTDRFLLGGAWSDPDYKFVEPEARPPFDRAPANGFRCMQSSGTGPAPQELARNMPLPTRDYARERPVSDQLFDAYRSQYPVRQDRPESGRRIDGRLTRRTGAGSESPSTQRMRASASSHSSICPSRPLRPTRR